jgi:Holliday junction resolvasome RuvABC endonuclease subunit
MGKLILGLDPSLSTVGYCLLTESKSLRKVGQYVVKKTLPFTRKIVSITDEVMRLAKEYGATDLVIEDIFYSKNVLNLKQWARLSGAIAYAWYKESGKEPEFIMACKARPLVGVKGNAQKIEVQTKIAHEFELIDNMVFYRYCGSMGRIIQQYRDKQITRNRYKYLMTKLSKQFEKETKISEHIADAILLALAHLLSEKGNV